MAKKTKTAAIVVVKKPTGKVGGITKAIKKPIPSKKKK